MKKIVFFATLLALFAFIPVSKKKLDVPKSYVFVPSQTIEPYGDPVSVQAFFMSQHEVTNAEYREFLADLKKSGNQDLYKASYPDTLAWLKIGGYMDAMANMYFWHPAYDNYPVVNISQTGANEYCKWLSKKLRANNSALINDVRLPTKYEWISAASGGLENATYPWGGPYLKNKKGSYLANFMVVGDQNIRETENGLEVVSDSTFLPDLSFADNAVITAPVDSYSPNGFGLYNMSGNVAELTSDPTAMGGHWKSTGYDIRIKSEIPFENANPFVGFRPVISHISNP